MQVSGGTVDAAEVAQFERLGADWWNPRGSMRALHKFNPLRIDWLTRSIVSRLPAAPDRGRDESRPTPLAGVTILDIGCGGGLLSEALARRGAAVTGIDPAAGNIAIASRHAEAGGLTIDYRATTAEDLLQTGVKFDVVCAMEVVEHVTDATLFIAAAAGLARPGGLLFAATLNRTLKSFAFAIIGAEYVLGWVPKGTHRWEKFVTPHELEEALEAAGLEAFARTGVVYDPLRDAWRESRDMSVNYMIAAERRA